MTKARDLSQTPNASLGFKNRIINGAMMIDQRNAGASVTVNSTAPIYGIDRFFGQAGSGGIFTVQRSTTAPAGFTNSLLATVTTTDTSIAAGDIYLLSQSIEGLNCADLAFGTASASPVTLSFWVRSSVTGTFSGSLSNSSFNRSFAFTYTINAANTFEYKTITIAGDTTGTWTTDTTTGLRVYFSFGAGSNYTGAAGSWTGSGLTNATGATNLIATNGATFYITGVQLEKGSTATSFDYRPYGTELALCQRYYSSLKFDGSLDFWLTGYLLTAEYLQQHLTLPVPMRATPTITTSGSFVNLNTSGLGFVAASPQTVWARLRATGTGTTYSYNSTALSIIASSEL